MEGSVFVEAPWWQIMARQSQLMHSLDGAIQRRGLATFCREWKPL